MPHKYGNVDCMYVHLCAMNAKPKILIAEDDHEDRFLIAESFSMLGYDKHVHFLEDGEELLNYLHDNGADEVGLLVLDMNMPKMTGKDVLKRIRDNNAFSHINVIIFSTSVNEVDKRFCTSLGIIDYIAKPMYIKEYEPICEKFYQVASGAAN